MIFKITATVTIFYYIQAMGERTNYLILVLCEDISMEDLDEDMRRYLRTNTYLMRDSRWFWEKLRYAMPPKPLLTLQDTRNLDVQRRNKDWSGVHALYKAQQAELAFFLWSASE